ncbi:MAG: hypothetical protein V1489_02175 [Candidatus Liptonbacteria bacterium]
MALKEYLETLRETLKKRAKESKVYKSFQLHGLEIAQILGDEKHRSLYIKLAKEHDPQMLRRIARSVAEKRGVRNRGAYFMAILSKEEKMGGSKKAPKTARAGKPSEAGKAAGLFEDKKENGGKNITVRKSC